MRGPEASTGLKMAREAMRPNYPGPEDSVRVCFHPVRNDTLLKGLRQGRDQIKFFPCQRTRRGSSGSMQPLPLPRDLPRAQREKQGWGKGAFALLPCKRSRTWPDQAPRCTHYTHVGGRCCHPAVQLLQLCPDLWRASRVRSGGEGNGPERAPR